MFFEYLYVIFEARVRTQTELMLKKYTFLTKQIN
jgi:hypothetical protein